MKDDMPLLLMNVSQSSSGQRAVMILTSDGTVETVKDEQPMIKVKDF